MEVAPYVQKIGVHAASLLASLNLQREQAQFCDCVVRQREGPGQLYPAHRCVLAGSSPVLASILSSTGALVELQAPCLSDSVLALLLDYIYTGALPTTHSKQQYYNLISAACYLQMDELQETLRTEVNTNASTGAENQTYKNNNSTFNKYLPSGIFSGSSMAREQYCDVMDACTSENGANPLKTVDESTRSGVSTDNCRHVNHRIAHDVVQNIPHTTEVPGVSVVDKEGHEDQFHSPGIVKSETWQMSTEEELRSTAEKWRGSFLICAAEEQEGATSRAEKTQRPRLTPKSKAEEKQTSRDEEDKINRFPLLHFSTSYLKDNRSPSQCLPPSCPPSTHPFCGAVPVIRHSSTATVEEVPSHHPVSQASLNSSRASDSQSGSTDSDTMDRNKNHTGTQSCDFNNRSDQCEIQDLCCKASVDQSDFPDQGYNTNNTDLSEHVSNGLSHITDENDQHAYCDSIQKDESTPLSKHCSFFTRGLKFNTDLSSDEFPTQPQQQECSHSHDVSMETAAEEQPFRSGVLRAVVPLPAQGSGTGSDSHCEDLCPEGEAKEAHSYPSRRLAGVGREDSHCDLNGPMNDWHPNLHRAERSTKYMASSQHEHAAACTYTIPSDNNPTDPTYNIVMQSYRGHLRYHCLPQETTHSSHADSDHKHSHPDRLDQSSDEEELSTFDSPGLSPLRQHFAPADQVLLLDISAKPAELLVSYRHRSDKRERWVAFGQRDTFGNGLADNDREQQHEASSVAEVDEKEIISKLKFEGENFDKAKTEIKSVGKEQSRSGAEVVHAAGFVEDDNQTATMTVCSPHSVPDSEQAPVSSSLPVCIPSTLSAHTATNISTHLSAPVHHPFQCSLCDRSFSQRGSLNRHVRSHLGVRPFPCPRCPMTFSRQYRVSEHMRVHQRCVIGSDFQKPTAS